MSHAWVKEQQRSPSWTEINYGEPISIPKDTSLSSVRIELLNSGAEYAWLDILCLRQEGPKEKEELRKEEWRLDLPTIGYTYQMSDQIRCYFNGLGRPFKIENLNDEKHRFNRAWTLQETPKIKSTMNIMGITEESPREIDGEENPNMKSFYQKLQYLQDAVNPTSCSILSLVDIMRPRHAAKELDKLFGLSYLLHPRIRPAYVEGQDLETAWGNLLETIGSSYRAQLFFCFPLPGKLRGHSWRPSWQQLLTTNTQHTPIFGGSIEYDPEKGVYDYHGFVIDETSCRVERLSGSSQSNRIGWILLSSNGNRAKMPIAVGHSQPIPDENCTLIADKYLGHWVIGRNVYGGFQKISIATTASHLDQPYLYTEYTSISRDALREWAAAGGRLGQPKTIVRSSISIPSESRIQPRHDWEAFLPRLPTPPPTRGCGKCVRFPQYGVGALSPVGTKYTRVCHITNRCS